MPFEHESVGALYITGSADFSRNYFSYVSSGNLEILSSALVYVSKPVEFSWQIEGYLTKEITVQWNTGDGDYYWYRVEGQCGEVKCDEFGVQYDCPRMTFLTVVPARNLAEVCDTLRSPKINPSVSLKVSSIKKYSRPVVKENIVDECNILEEQEFCQIPECLDYCIDFSPLVVIPFKTVVYEAIYNENMSGAISFYGSALIDRYKFYQPTSPSLVFLGSLNEIRVKYSYLYGDGGITMGSQNLDYLSSSYKYDSNGEINVEGKSYVVSANKFYSANGSIEISGEVKKTYRNFTSTLEIDLSNDLEFFVRYKHSPEGSVELGGEVSDYTSPRYFYQPNSSILFEGDGFTNFYDLELILINNVFISFGFDMKIEIDRIDASSSLTISNQTISPACGCGPLNLSLNLRHNLINSSILNNFIRRNGLSFSDLTTMKYKSADSAWHSIQHFSGRGRDGVSLEDWKIFFILQCRSDVWRLDFTIKSVNRTTSKDYQTKLTIDMPADFICSDGNISTNILFDPSASQVSVGNGVTIPVVIPVRTPTTTSQYSLFVDGVFNDYVVYYDNMGIFKNSYWDTVPFEININPISRVEMPTLDLSSIF